MRKLSPAGYLLRFVATMCGAFAAVWLYVLLAALAFMPSGYSEFAAKRAILRACQPSTVSFFGDSRVEAGIIPARLRVAAANLGIGGGTPIEVLIAVRQALHCGSKPGLVVISFSPDHFGPLNQLFWSASIG